MRRPGGRRDIVGEIGPSESRRSPGDQDPRGWGGRRAQTPLTEKGQGRLLLATSGFVFRDGKKIKVKTFIGDANRFLWTAIGFSFFAPAFIFSKEGWQYCYPIYILLYSIGTYVTGSLIKFKPLIIGAIICFPLAIITAYTDFDTKIIMLALAILVSYIIPGHLLRIQYIKQHH